MQLLDYLALKSQTITEFASEVEERLGHATDPDSISAAVTRIWRHAHGKRHPGPEDQALYEELTKGAVTPRDWIELALKLRDQPPDDAAETVAATG